MKIIDAATLQTSLSWLPLIDAIENMFVEGCRIPLRHHHDVDVPNADAATLLIMPAWSIGGYIGVKVVNIFPSNSERGLPAISGTYLLSDGKTGQSLAILDGAELTARRTAAASALAAKYLAKSNAENLLVVGAGKLSLNLIEAHYAAKPFKKIEIWARREAQAQAIANLAQAKGIYVSVSQNLEVSARQADIISCCTLSKSPLILGEWVQAGTHIDLVGAFKPDMRETDDALIAKATVFADTFEGVFKEAGDILLPIKSGAIDKSHVVADLFNLTKGTHQGRKSDHEITVYKSVGTALEDLAAAILAYEA